MDNKPNTPPIPTSFMPKQKIAYNLGQRKESMGILMAIAVIVIVLSILFFAGALGYRYYLSYRINAPCVENSGKACGLKADIALKKEQLAKLDLLRLKKLDAKIKLADSVLSRHTTMVPVFNFLGDYTIRNVQFRKFQFDEKGVTLEGVARRYEDVAVQAKALEEAVKKGAISSFSFSNFDLDNKGNVTFELILTVDNSLIRYKQTVAEAPASADASTEDVEVNNTNQ